MPTPFMHLQVAEQIRVHPALAPDVGGLLARHWPDFYAGSVMADYQTICNIPREETHFYNLPPAPTARPLAELIATYPQVGLPKQLAPGAAVFIAAYGAHLMLDVRWFHEILLPYFVNVTDWPVSRHERFLIHNVLLTYLDRLAVASLPAGADQILAQADLHDRLPFAAETDLCRWRDMLVQQLAPGAEVQTVAIYAERLGMTPETFAARLEDEMWMAEQVFQRVPLEAVRKMLAAAVTQSITLIADYLQPLWHRRDLPTAP